MKTVTSKDLERMAIAKGAELDDGVRRVNPSQLRAVVARRPERREPAPAPAHPHAEQMRALAEQQAATVRAVSSLVDVVSAMSEPQQPAPRAPVKLTMRWDNGRLAAIASPRWTFELERNERGRIASITATPRKA